jgi:hypothetical protein
MISVAVLPKGSERIFLFILRYSVFASSYDGCNDNIFVDIKPTADGENKPHHKYHHLNKSKKE